MSSGLTIYGTRKINIRKEEDKAAIFVIEACQGEANQKNRKLIFFSKKKKTTKQVLQNYARQYEKEANLRGIIDNDNTSQITAEN